MSCAPLLPWGIVPCSKERSQRAEIALDSLTTHAGTGQFPSIRAMVDTDLSGWLPITGVQLDRQMVERILTEAESVFQRS